MNDAGDIGTRSDIFQNPEDKGNRIITGLHQQEIGHRTPLEWLLHIQVASFLPFYHSE